MRHGLSRKKEIVPMIHFPNQWKELRRLPGFQTTGNMHMKCTGIYLWKQQVTDKYRI